MLEITTVVNDVKAWMIVLDDVKSYNTIEYLLL